MGWKRGAIGDHWSRNLKFQIRILRIDSGK